MPIKLDTPAEQVDVESPAFATLLANLQADILRPHGRAFVRHIFLRFTGPPINVRRWIGDEVAPRVTSAAQQLAAATLRRRERSAVDGGLVLGFYLSARGYRFLGFDTAGFASESFVRSMKDQTSGVFSQLVDTDNEDPAVAEWEPAFRSEIHALVSLADDDETRLQLATDTLVSGLAGVAALLGVERGNVLKRGGNSVEHFGYLDGISQPLFTRQDLERDRERNPRITDWDPSARLSLLLVDDPFSSAPDAFGSYLVYRKLGQDVARFEASVAQLGSSLGASPALAGAYAVGRFKDGTPVELAAAPASNLAQDNDFNYTGDRDGLRCPFHAHIRKANPRGTTPLTTLPNEKKRRIARRGIPYGLPVSGTADNLPANDDPAAQRGLLFLCFQANIEDQFEFIQRTWVDNQHFPTAVLSNGIFQRDTGDDPLIGQDRDEAQRWPKAWNSAAAGKKSFNFESAVKLEGGEYFFAPSLPFLASL